MKLNFKPIVITVLSLMALLMTASVALARDYVVPDAPLNVVYDGGEQFGQVNLSADGRFVVVSSLVDGHVYVHDRQNNTTERVSVNNQGEPLPSFYGGSGISISDDGRYVVFPKYTDEYHDYLEGIYIRDRLNGKTRSINVNEYDRPVSSYGANSAFITGDGRFVVFWGESDVETCENEYGCTSVYVYDQNTKKTEMVSVNDDGLPADNASGYADISDNGRYVAFVSDATNLSGPNLECEDGGGEMHRCSHLYLHDRQKKTTRYIPFPNDWAETQLIVGAVLYGLNISASGRYIVYSYPAEGENETPYMTYVYDTLTEVTETISVGEENTLENFTYQMGLNVISDDGRFLVLGKSGDDYIYLHDRVANITTRMTDSLEQPFEQKPFAVTYPAALSISGDGSTILFFVDDGGIASGTNHLAHGQTFTPAPYTEVELVQNGGAEAQGVMTKMPQNWDITDYRAGRRRCDHFPNTDSCVFQIKPVKDKIARLTQSVPAVNNPGDTLNFSASVRGFNVSRATIRVLVNYADGTTAFVKIPSATLNDTYNYKQVTANLTLDKLAYSIKVQMYIHNRGTGKLLVDDVSLKLGSGESEALDLIPVPDAPTLDTLPGRTTN